MERMHRRYNSNRAGRISRRRSTSSTHSKHESIYPEVARQHAQVAASGNGHSRSNTASSNQDHLPPSQQGNVRGIAEHGIRRQQSVRFVGPNAVQRRQSIGNRATRTSIEQKTSTVTLRPIAMTTNAPVPAAYRPPSRSSSIGKASMGRERAENFVTTVAAYNEYYTREDDIASTPSSYRRIRKSKSMFSPLKAPSVFYTNGTPERPGSSYRGSHHYASNYQISQDRAFEAPLRIQRSVSSLRSRREPITRERNDVAVQMARDRFFQQTTQQRLREQPSFIYRSKAHRQEKPFRKSVRSTSTNSRGIPLDSSDQSQPSKESRLRHKARKASKSIKAKFQRVFGISKDPVDIPNQQINARETHVRRYCGDPDPDLERHSYEGIPHPTKATLLRVASRPPSVYDVNSEQQLKSYAGSVDSVRSDVTVDKSRATSWNSTGVDTVASQAARLQAEKELQRLSIINENGTHITSSSFNRPRLNQSSAYPLHHKPSSSANSNPPHAPGPVDSARVYSALMKRLDENSPKAQLEASRNPSLESFVAARSAPQHCNSNSSSKNKSLVTIRHVLSDDNNSSETCMPPSHQWVRSDSIHAATAEDIFGPAGLHTHQWIAADPLREARMRQEDDVFSPEAMVPENDTRSSNTFDPSAHATYRQASTKTSYSTVPETLRLTPQETALRNEPSAQGAKPLRESRSTFFGGSSFTVGRTTSPFRRALAESGNSILGATLIPNCGQDQPLQNPLYSGTRGAAHVPSSVRDTDDRYSESAYSRTTSGKTPAAASNSPLSLLINEANGPAVSAAPYGNGDVVILDRATYRPTMPANEGHRVTSSAGSTEWKQWMSFEVAKLERAKENINAPAPYVNYALPTMPRSFHAGHLREGAQIGDDYPEMDQNHSSAVKQPLGILQQNTNAQNHPQLHPQNIPPLKPILKNRLTASLVENINFSVPSGNGPPIPPPPPIPVRSPLRPKQSTSSLGSVNTAHKSRSTCTTGSAVKAASLSGRNLLHKRNGSTAALRRAKSTETLGKLVKKAKRSPYAISSPNPGSGVSTTVEKQFGSTSARSRTPRRAWNAHHDDPKLDQEKYDMYGTQGAGLMGPAMTGVTHDLDAQQMGSKRMVDMFLSSRRKQIAGGSDESGAVFI